MEEPDDDGSCTQANSDLLCDIEMAVYMLSCEPACTAR